MQYISIFCSPTTVGRPVQVTLDGTTIVNGVVSSPKVFLRENPLLIIKANRYALTLRGTYLDEIHFAILNQHSGKHDESRGT